MSERYSKLFALPENLYAAGSPVVIAAGALLKDNQTGKVIAQLKMRNISQKPIKAAKVSIHPLDTVDNPLGGKIEYQYLDLSAARDEDFGQKAPVALPDAATRSFTASVEEIVFADNSIWTATGEPWEVLDTPGSLRSIGDAELIKQYRLKYGNNCKNLPLLHKDLWYCACGELNRQGEAECHRCQKSLALLEQIDMDALRKERDTRVAAEKEQAEKEAAEAKAHAKKMGQIAAIVVPILVVLIVAAVIISNSVKKSNAYEFALSLVESGQYEDAIEHFAALGDYKDSAEQMQLAEAALLEAEQDNAYADAIALLEAGKHGEAYAALEALGDYKDSKELLSSFVYRLVESNGVRYKYDAYGNLVEKNYGSWSYYYQYEENRLVWEGTSGSDWGATTYTYYADGTLKSTIAGVSRNSSSGAVTTQTVYYNENGYPETVIHERDNSPKENQTWDLSYTISDSGSITALVCSVKDAGAAETITESFDFGDYEGLVSIEIVANDSMPVRLTFTNKDRTSEEYYFLSFNSYISSFSMRKHCEITTEYDSSGRIASETTFYPTTKGKITQNYSYDNQGNVIEARSNANENTDKKLYVTTYTYGYIYCPDET